MLILASKVVYYTKDPQGNRVPCPIPNDNDFVVNIKSNLLGNSQFLYIANNPIAHEENDVKMQLLMQALRLTGIEFVKNVVLDDRTKHRAGELIKGADLIFIAGGKIPSLLTTLNTDIIKTALAKTYALIIGTSAGSMVLTNNIFNFPEYPSDLLEKRELMGLGLVDLCLIPHLDGTTLKYQGTATEIDVVNDYILPYSEKRTLTAIPNGSYITYCQQNLRYYGPHYVIKNREVTKFVD